MRDIPVTFDERRGGYVAERAGVVPVSALSLAGLRRRLEASERRAVRLVLDKHARAERDERRRGGPSRRADAWSH